MEIAALWKALQLTVAHSNKKWYNTIFKYGVEYGH